MKKDLKDRWTAKLRSGDVDQMQGQLGNDKGRRCCIGVLAEVARPELDAAGIKILIAPNGDMTVGGQDGSLPAEATVLLGLDIDLEGRAVELNDDEGFTFAQIADWIDANVVMLDSELPA